LKPVQYYAVVTDEEDNGNVKLVWADVYHPDGSFKYEVPMSKIPKADADGDGVLDVVELVQNATAAGLVTFNASYTLADVVFELEKCTAELWRGQADLDYHQPAGNYRADYYVTDQNDNLVGPLSNLFLYVPVACCEFDFTNVNYGSVSISVNKWKAGDTDFTTPAFPTVRNIGNIPCKITINQTDMTFGKDVTGRWNVEFDARLGNAGTVVVYNPHQKVTLPDALPNCNTEEIDFSIHVIKGFGNKTGTMTLGCVPA
jgi:hypothetical protein